MNRKESLCKRKAPGFANREVRAKFKEQRSRSNREELLASKRRIPLSVLQDQDQSTVESKKTLSTKERSDLRLEKLKQWKKQREVAKSKEKKDKTPFNYGTSTAGFKPSVKTGSQNIFVNSKPQTTSMSKPGSTKMICKDRPLKRKAPPVTSRNTTAAPSNTVKTKPSSKVSKPAPVTRVSSRLTTKPKEDTSAKSVVPKKTRPQTRSMSKSTASGTKVGTNTQKNSRIKPQVQSKQIAGTKKSTTNKNTSGRTVTTRTSKKVQKYTEEKMEIIVEVDNPAAMETDDGNVSPPPTPKGKNYAPVRPSPLLRSTSARRRETLFAGPKPVTDPTWIPGHSGQTIEPVFSQPNFDDAFGNEFSPFRFGNSDSSFQFTFRKNPPPEFSISYSSDSLDEEPLTSSVTPDPKVIRRSLGSSCKNTPVRHITTNENVMIVELVREDTQSTSDEDMEVVHSSEDSEKPEINIPYFRKVHSDVTNILTMLCDKWDVKVAGLETDLTDGGEGIDDEVLGQLRTTIGQGRLLMRQKLKQYIGLVDIAEVQSGERKTTAEDLQGFWDMVYFQVEDVYQKFKGLEKIEENGWTVRAPTPKKKKGKKRQAVTKKASVSTNAEESERQKAAREKREAQRNRLKEMRQAAKRTREETAVVCDSEQENFTTPKKSKTDVSTPKSGSAYKHGRRHSLRLRNRSVFSPCPGSVERKPFTDVNQDIPIATLISFN